MDSYNIIKEKIKSILNSQNTKNFFSNLAAFGLSIGNTQLNNKFINEVFFGDGVEIINKYSKRQLSDDIIINGEKILVRTNSLNNQSIYILSIPLKKNEQVDFNIKKEIINNMINNISYIFLIRIEDNFNDETGELDVCYHYYLFPAEKFKIIEDNPNINDHSFSGKNWIFKKNYTTFYGKYSLYDLHSHNICLPYIKY